MSKRLRLMLAGAGVAALVTVFAWGLWPRHGEMAYLLREASPGPVASAHAFLEGDCGACHARLDSVPPAQCIACHADETELLQRQPTAFHASVGACAECHKEHRGRAALRARMNHDALARVALRRLGLARADDRVRNPVLSPLEAALECSHCHSTKDRHRGVFGNDCVACHTTAGWTVAQFRHPPPASRDCAQCHRAPPSHYMEHFAMVSQRVAGREHAPVRECYQCHQTTAWNDIRGAGLYKHH